MIIYKQDNIYLQEVRMKKTSFSVKLVCYIVIVSLAALLISASMISIKMVDILEEDMQLTSRQTMNAAMTSFQRYAKTLSLPIDLMCRSNDFKKIDENYEDRLSGIEDSLLSALKVIPNSEKTYYATTSGRYIQAKMHVSDDGKKTGEYVEQEGIDNTAKNWFADCQNLAGRHTVFGNFTDPYVNDDGISVFTVSQDLKSGDNHVGVVAMDINVKVLEEYINDIKLMNTGFTFLANESGSIIVNNTENNVISSALEIPVWNELIAEAEAYAQEELAQNAEAEVTPFASMSCKINGEKYVVTLLQDSITGWYLVGLIGEAELAAGFHAIMVTTVACVVLALILSVLVALFVAYSISREIKKLQAATQRMAEGDLSTKLTIKRLDEFGELERNFNVMMDSISGLIQEVDGNSEEIFGIARSVLEVSENTKEVAEQVTEAIGSVAQGATEQAQSTADANIEVERLAQSMQATKEKTDSIGDRSRETAELGKKGIVILDELIEKSERAKTNASESVEMMSEMLKSIDKINYIANVITDITAQTNLLSLNASIEAARAGESGKGFAVVADEIRKLADQSKESTEEIKQILAEISGNSDHVGRSLKESGVLQEEQQSAIKETQSMFEEIERSVRELLQAVEEIEALNLDMNAARDNVVNRMEDIASVSETSAAATEEVNASAEQVNDTMSQMAGYAKVLDEIVNKLRISVKQFKL